MKTILLTCSFLLWSNFVFPQWLHISNVEVNKMRTEHGGFLIAISYDLNEEGISENLPAYIFLRYSNDQGKTWTLVDHHYLKGNGFGIVGSAGEKDIMIWGSAETGMEEGEIRIRGIRMARIPAGSFNMRSFPAGGKDPFKTLRPDTDLPEYYMMVNETTISMYTEYLNEAGGQGSGWQERMSNEKRCGIERTGTALNFHYELFPGRENYPIIYVSWYDAYAFLGWCGLTLPTEAMFEKAYAGGYYLDGDESRSLPNPNPERKFPWGDELPDQDGIYRCNFDGDEDGYSNTAPAGTFKDFPSPYGIHDLAGNVAEWTLDWYTTNYHVGLDGFRMVRGGSWLSEPVACDAISGATQFPIKESSIMGFRGVMVK